MSCPAFYQMRLRQAVAWVAILTMLGFVNELRAAVVFDFETQTGVGTSSEPLLLTTSDFMGSGVTNLDFDAAGNPGSAARGHNFNSGTNTSNSNYYFFDLTIAPDTLLELTTLTFDEFAEDGPGPHRGPTMFQIVVNGTAIGSPTSTNFGSFGSQSIDLSALSFLNESVRVEFHGWGAFNQNQQNEWFIDNVNLGFETSAVPEPSSSLLLVCSMGVLLVRRRRRKRRVP